MEMCYVCGVQYKSRNGLLKHLRIKHNIQRESHKCAHCDFITNIKREIRRHVTTHMANPKSRLLCALQCGTSINRYKLYRVHLQREHNLNIVINKRNFANINDFKKWKSEMEVTYRTTYRKESTHKNYVYYICSRSYSQQITKNRERAMKSVGSIKIGYACPSTVVLRKKNSVIEAEYCLTHLHECDIKYQRLPEEQRKEIAEKLSIGISVNKILEDVRNSTDIIEDRIHLLEKRDIYNIKKSFNINDINKYQYCRPTISHSVPLEMVELYFNTSGMETNINN